MNDATLRAHMQEVRRRFCPSDDEMTSYSQRRLDSKRAEEIREHVSTCEYCEQTLEDVEDFFTGSVPPLSRDIIDEDFRRVWSQPAASKPFRFVRRYVAVAASLLIALAGVAWSIWSRQGLQQEVTALTREVEVLRAEVQAGRRAAGPRTQIRLVELFSADTYTRNERQSNVAQVLAPEGSELVFVLNGQGDGLRSGMVDHPSYRIELFDREKRLRWRTEDLSRAGTGTFIISLPAAYLEPGRYGIVLTGGQTTKEYDFEIRSN